MFNDEKTPETPVVGVPPETVPEAVPKAVPGQLPEHVPENIRAARAPYEEDWAGNLSSPRSQRLWVLFVSIISGLIFGLLYVYPASFGWKLPDWWPWKGEREKED